MSAIGGLPTLGTHRHQPSRLELGARSLWMAVLVGGLLWTVVPDLHPGITGWRVVVVRTLVGVAIYVTLRSRARRVEHALARLRPEDRARGIVVRIIYTLVRAVWVVIAWMFSGRHRRRPLQRHRQEDFGYTAGVSHVKPRTVWAHVIGYPMPTRVLVLFGRGNKTWDPEWVRESVEAVEGVYGGAWTYDGHHSFGILVFSLVR